MDINTANAIIHADTLSSGFLPTWATDGRGTKPYSAVRKGNRKRNKAARKSRAKNRRK